MEHMTKVGIKNNKTNHYKSISQQNYAYIKGWTICSVGSYNNFYACGTPGVIQLIYYLIEAWLYVCVHWCPVLSGSGHKHTMVPN